MAGRSRDRLDVAVIGLGGLGSATAYALARRGRRVIGFEQFELGHVRGASHDHSRIIRRSYHTPHYVELTEAAYRAWNRVGDAAGRAMITPTGGVDLFPAGAAIDIDTYTQSMDEVGVPYEVIGGAEIRHRWPVFAVGDDVTGLYQSDTGIVDAAAATATMQRLAAALGAELRDRSPVDALAPIAGGRYRLTIAPSGGDSYDVEVDQVVIAADAWTNHLLAPLDARVPLTVLREQLSYFELPSAAVGAGTFAVGAFPVWIWMDDPSFYGFPEFGKLGKIKAAEDCGGRPVDPDTRSFDPSSDAEERLRSFLSGLVRADLGAAQSATCLYTLTPDRDFVLDRVPGHRDVVVLLGAAHAFKFAAWFGMAAAELLTDGRAIDDITPFRFDRPGLAETNDRSAWLV